MFELIDNPSYSIEQLIDEIVVREHGGKVQEEYARGMEKQNNLNQIKKYLKQKKKIDYLQTENIVIQYINKTAIYL